MAAARRPLAAVLLLLCLWLHVSSPLPPCPESCTCQRATLVNCSSSALSLVPPHIQDSVAELDLSDNFLSAVALSRQLPNLRRVWLGKNTITLLSLCTERPNGGQHVRGGYRHRSRPQSTQGCLSWAPTLQVLSVERNQLVQVPEGLETTTSLQVLQLSFNRISALQPEDLSHLSQLKELHVQHNFITTLDPQMFQGLAQLRVLDLSYNLLTSLHPVMYLSLHNVGADVRLGGNMWRCDCTMRNLRRRLAYDSSRGLQAWNVVCASPSTLSGRDLLQVEEGDFNCSNAENTPELHRDVTVDIGSDILLSCSAEDSVWWTPNGQTSGNQPQGALRISKTTEKDTGLYVCISQLEQKAISIFNLQIRNTEKNRKTRSLSRTSHQVIPQDTSPRNQRAVAQPDLTLAVVLSVLITFLVAFVLGVLTRPFIDVLWRRVFKKRSSSPTHSQSVSAAAQTQYDNEAYATGEEYEDLESPRERRVTFSSTDFGVHNTVSDYDTEAGGNKEETNNYARKKHDKHNNTEANYRPEKDKRIAGEAATNKRKAGDLSQVNDVSMEYEHIPDPGEVMERISLSSQSDSSRSGKILKNEQVAHQHHSALMSSQVEENPVRQRGDFPKVVQKEVPPFSSHDSCDTSGFSDEPSADWSSHKNIKPVNPDLWQENEEQFEFSDSVNSDSARSSPRKDVDMSSSSSYMSDDEPTHYTVNLEPLEDRDIKTQKSLQRYNQSDYTHETPSPPFITSSSHVNEEETGDYKKKMEQKVVGTAKSPIKEHQTASHDPEIRWPTLHLGHITPSKRHLDIKATSTPSRSSSSSETEEKSMKKWEQRQVGMGKIPFKQPFAPSDSCSSSDSEGDTTDYTKKKQQMELGMTKSPLRDHQTTCHDPEIRWPTLDLGHVTPIKKRLDIKAPSLHSTSSSSSEEETDYNKKRGQKKVDVPRFSSSSHDPEMRCRTLDHGHTTPIKRQLDIKPLSAPVDSYSSSDNDNDTMKKQEQRQVGMPKFSFKAPPPGSDSSSSTDSEEETVSKQREMEAGMTKSPIGVHLTASHDLDLKTRWPALDLGHITPIKRRLAIKLRSPPVVSSSSSVTEEETMKKQEQRQVGMSKLSFKAPPPASDSSASTDSEEETVSKQREMEAGMTKSPIAVHLTASHDLDLKTRWPALDLGHITPIKRRLAIKLRSPPVVSSSSSVTEEETMKKQEQRQVGMSKLSFKAPPPASDSSASTDSEEETVSKQREMEAGMTKSPIGVHLTASHDPKTRWPAVDLGHVAPIKRRLDIKAPSPPFRNASEKETKMQVQREVNIAKSPSPPSDSSSCSNSEEETEYIKKKEQKKVDLPRFLLKESWRSSHDPEIRWPTLDLGHITQIKRRLDIKARSLHSHSSSSSSSSSSDSDEETGYIKKPGQKEMQAERFPLEEAPHFSDIQTGWPTIDLGNITPIKRHLDIKIPSQSSHSSSSSDSDQDQRDYMKKYKQKRVENVSLNKSPYYNHETATRWPTVDLGHISPINRHLDFKIPSPSSHSSSSSDSEQEPTDCMKKHEQKELEAKNIQHNKSPCYNHETETRWPTIDLGHITTVKKRLDIKVALPPVDSSSSSDSDEETINKQREVGLTKFPFKESQTASSFPKTRWPALNEHIILHKNIKPVDPDLWHENGEQFEFSDSVRNGSARSNVLFGPPHDSKQITVLLSDKRKDSDTSSSSSYISDGEPTHYTVNPEPLEDRDIQSQKLSQKYNWSDYRHETPSPPSNLSYSSAKFPFKESQSSSNDPEIRWPTLDLGHITQIKRRLDIKPLSPPVDSSSSSDSEEETAAYINKRKQKEVKETFQLSQSPRSNHETETRWPTVDLGHITPIKRCLDIKVALPPVESSSSSDSEEETKKQKEVGLTKFPFKEPESASSFPQTRWPALDHRITPVKRHLDIKVSLPPETTDNIKEEDIEAVGFPVKESQTIRHHQERWPTPAKHISSVPSCSQSSESNSSSSASEDEDKANKNMKIPLISKTTEATMSIHSHDKADHIKLEKPTLVTDKVETKPSAENINPVPEVNPELQSRWAAMNLASSRVRKRLDMTMHKSPDVPSSEPPDSSRSVKENERSRQKRWELGTQGIKNAESLISKDRPVLLVSKEAEDRASSQSSESSSSSENEEESLGQVDREWREKAQLTSVTDKGVFNQTSQDHSQTQNKEVQQKATAELEGQTSKAEEPDSAWPHLSFTNISHVKILDTKTMSQRVPSFHRKEYDIMDHTVPVKTDVSDTRLTSHETVNSAKAAKEGSSHGARDVIISSMTFDRLVKRRIEQSKETLDVDQGPEIRWTGVGHHLPDRPLSSQRRYMDGNHLIPQQSPPAGSEHQRLHSSSSSSSSSSSESEGKQATADASQMHKYSYLQADKGIYKFDNLSNSTSEVVSREDGGERKGLNALKAMSSERNKWDREDDDLRKGASHKYGDQASTTQGATSFNYLSSATDTQMLTKQPLPDSLLQPSSGDDKRALELLYHIPQYRTHVFRATPPPRPETPPPDEAPNLTWRSQHSFNRQNWRSVSPYLQQGKGRNPNNLPPSSQNHATHFVPSNMMSDV